MLQISCLQHYFLMLGHFFMCFRVTLRRKLIEETTHNIITQ